MRSADVDRLSGIIELEETWVGGKQRGVGRKLFQAFHGLVTGPAESDRRTLGTKLRAL